MEANEKKEKSEQSFDVASMGAEGKNSWLDPISNQNSAEREDSIFPPVCTVGNQSLMDPPTRKS